MALNRVQVIVVGALDLPAMDGQTSDPYVKFHYKGKEYRTPTLKKTLQPKWNYTTEFAYNKVFGPHLLYLEVWDANVIRSDKFIGKATLNMEFLEVNKAVDKWYPLEQVAKAQDSAALRVKLTLLPPLTEAYPNAGEGQKMVVVAHRNAPDTAAGRLVYPTSTLQNTYGPVPSAAPPPVYPLYSTSPTPATYAPPVAPSSNYCYSPLAPPPLTYSPPIAHVPSAHPPPSGYPVPCASPWYPVPSASPSPFAGVGAPDVNLAPPTDSQNRPVALNITHQGAQTHRKAGKMEHEKEPSSSGSERSSGNESPGKRDRIWTTLDGKPATKRRALSEDFF